MLVCCERLPDDTFDSVDVTGNETECVVDLSSVGEVLDVMATEIEPLGEFDMVFDFSKVSSFVKEKELEADSSLVGESEAERDCVSDALKLNSFVRDAEGENDCETLIDKVLDALKLSSFVRDAEGESDCDTLVDKVPDTDKLSSFVGEGEGERDTV